MSSSVVPGGSLFLTANSVSCIISFGLGNGASCHWLDCAPCVRNRALFFRVFSDVMTVHMLSAKGTVVELDECTRILTVRVQPEYQLGGESTCLEREYLLAHET